MDPKDVFLAADGTWRRSFTTNATIKIHDSYKSYCNRLAAVIANATAATDSPGRDILLEGLEFRLKQRLDKTDTLVDPGKPDWDKTLGGLLEAAVQKKVRVRILIGGASGNADDLALAKQLGITAVLDTQHDARPHHMKTVYVRPGDSKDKSPILFVGGMDLAHTPRGWERTFWFDTMAEISGTDGARIGVATLEERWLSAVENKPLPPTTGTKAGTTPERKGTETLVTYVRTYSNAPGDKNSAQRQYKKDYSYRDTVLRGIAASEDIIYLEDQFFARVPDVDRALVDAANQKDGPTIVVIAARVNENEQHYRSTGAMLSGVKDKNRMHLLRLKFQDGRKPALIHTKAWIFDDEIALVGSGNYWDGSLGRNDTTQDTELGVVFASPSVGTLRVQLWNRMIASATKPVPIPAPSGSSWSFYDELAVLMDRTVADLKSVTSSPLMTGPRSTFEALPPSENDNG